MKANALFSLSSAMIMLIFYAPLTELMQFRSAYILPLLGVGLLLFAASVFWIATRSQLEKGAVRSIILQDWLWVAGSLALIVFQPFGISTPGHWIIGIVALAVADFAVLQQYYLKRAVAGSGASL